MKKILYLITQSEFGGAQRYIFDLAKNFSKQKFFIEIAVGKPGTEEWLKELESQSIKIWRLKHLVRLHLWHNFLSFFEIYKLIKTTKPDVVHLNSSMAGFIGAIAAKLFNTKCQMLASLSRERSWSGVKGQMLIVYTAHGLVLNEPLPIYKKIIFWLFELLGNLMTNHIICVSHFDKKSILKYKLAPEKKLTVIHNGISSIEFLPKEQAKNKIFTNYQLPITDYLIGTIANLYPNKGLKYLIKAIHLLSKMSNVKCQMSNVCFVIIGKGQQKQELEKLIKKYNLKNVYLIGEIPKAYKLLKAFDLFVLPSVKEGLSYTLIEALSAGLPVIATTVGGNPEIIENNKNGLLVPPANPTSLAEAIKKLLNNQNLRLNLTKSNLEKAKEFNLEKMISQTEEVYKIYDL